jgi:hypothetical protein
MAKTPAEPLFLARESYRRRRLGDAARLLPLFGLVLLLLPGLLGAAASAMVYIFVVWAVLIVLVAVLSPRLANSEPETAARTDPAQEG